MRGEKLPNRSTLRRAGRVYNIGLESVVAGYGIKRSRCGQDLLRYLFFNPSVGASIISHVKYETYTV